MNESVVRAVSVVRVTVVAPHHKQVPDPAAVLRAGPARPPDAPEPRRTDDGGPPPTVTAPTELERQALAWDAARERARSVARAIESEVGTHPDVRSVSVDGDTVRVLLSLAPPFSRWAGWREYLGITVVGGAAGSRTLAGEGRRDGVRVTALVRQTGLVRQAGGQERSFRLGDTTYDLALPYRDAHGETWYFQGRRAPDGMPLMSLDGRTERCSLVNVAQYAGPLTPVLALADAATPDEGTR